MHLKCQQRLRQLPQIKLEEGGDRVRRLANINVVKVGIVAWEWTR
jgi:hypothetical protein